MSDTPCTCQANHPAAAGNITINTTPTVADVDPVMLDRVVSAFTAAAADSADTRVQAIEARIAELEQVVASILTDSSLSSMQQMPA